MIELPEYVKHIRNDHDSTNSFCGERLAFDWAFISTSHAIAERISKGRLLPCPDCVKKINEILSRTD